MNFERLRNLCRVYGVSGAENECTLLIKKIMEPYCDSMFTDVSGNLFCIKKSKKENAPTIMLDAHTDSVGFMVKEVCEGGFLKFDEVGGIDPRILPALEVSVHGRKEVCGVITSKPPHLMKDNDKEKCPKIKDLYIDTGNESGIEVGDKVSFVQRADIMGECVTGTYLDDRAGCSAITEVFEYFSDKELSFNLVGAFTVQEELGLCGAKFADISPDLAIVIDVTHGSTPDEKGNRVYKTGGGCAIGAGPNVDSDYLEMIKGCAENNGLIYQIEVMEGNTGTNAWAYQIKNSGTPCLILSFPLKFMHTPTETMKISDFDNTVDLLKAFLSQLDANDIKQELAVVKREVR